MNNILNEDDASKKRGGAAKLIGAGVAGAIGIKALGKWDDYRKSVGAEEYKQQIANKTKVDQEMTAQIHTKAQELATSTKHFEDLPTWAKVGVGVGAAATAGLAAHFLKNRFKYVAPKEDNRPDIQNKPGQIIAATHGSQRPTQGPISGHNKPGNIIKYTGK